MQILFVLEAYKDGQRALPTLKSEWVANMWQTHMDTFARMDTKARDRRPGLITLPSTILRRELWKRAMYVTAALICLLYLSSCEGSSQASQTRTRGTQASPLRLSLTPVWRAYLHFLKTKGQWCICTIFVLRRNRINDDIVALRNAFK
jgi:hypothetical protein